MKRFASAAFLIACIGVSIACAINVFADDTALTAQAGELACKGLACAKPATLTRVDRTPIAQTFTFAAGKTGSSVTVRCARSAILVGDYACVKE
jgi:hypothetical protein